MKDLFQKGKALWADFSAVNATTFASSISYFAFLSLIPLLVICISLVSTAGIGEQEVTAFFTVLVPEEFSGFISMLVSEAYEHSGIALSISAVTLLWSASKVIKALRAGLNAACGVQESRNGPLVILISIATVIILGLLFAAAIFLIFSGYAIGLLERFFPDLQQHGNILIAIDSLATLVFGTLVLTACYAYLPVGTRRFASQLPGAVMASFACGALSLGFHIYVDHFNNYTVLYGGIATIALFLFWMYLVSYILLAGSFMNRCIKPREHEEE